MIAPNSPFSAVRLLRHVVCGEKARSNSLLRTSSVQAGLCSRSPPCIDPVPRQPARLSTNSTIRPVGRLAETEHQKGTASDYDLDAAKAAVAENGHITRGIELAGGRFPNAVSFDLISAILSMISYGIAPAQRDCRQTYTDKQFLRHKRTFNIRPSAGVLNQRRNDRILSGWPDRLVCHAGGN